jgi:putative glutathione S-transferase
MSKAKDSLAEMDNGNGIFARTASVFREIISLEHPIHKPEKNRYHLYISLACPWANRCLIVLKLKGLQDCIGVTVSHPTWQRSRPDDAEDSHCGWAFCEEDKVLPASTDLGQFAVKNCGLDTINGCANARDLYELSAKNSGTVAPHKFTVPILWDKKTGTIVNNESSEIIRIINTAFDEWATGIYIYVYIYICVYMYTSAYIYTSIYISMYRYTYL